MDVWKQEKNRILSDQGMATRPAHFISTSPHNNHYYHNWKHVSGSLTAFVWSEKQGSHSDWKNLKTRKNGKAFSSQGKSGYFKVYSFQLRSLDWVPHQGLEKSREITQNTGKLREFQTNIICVSFAKMDQVFSLKNKTLNKYWKNGKKYWKSQGILWVRKSGNHAF